jgi:hypothetical protein
VSNDLVHGCRDGLLVKDGARSWDVRGLARAAAVADRCVTELSPQVFAELVVELRPRWQARQDARLADRPRRRGLARAPGTGSCLLTGCWPPWCSCATGSPRTCSPAGSESRFTISRAIGEVRSLVYS